MTKLGVTGHQRLPQPETWEWVSLELKALLGCASQPLTGITSLAIGTDQLFARSVLERNGTLEVVVPFDKYETTFAETDRAEFERLFQLSSRTETLPRVGSDDECYLAAGRRVVDLSDMLITVWDGEPARGRGGTADIVHYALTRHMPLVHINPSTKVVLRR